MIDLQEEAIAEELDTQMAAPIDPPAGDDLHHPSGRPLTYDELSGGF